jgi:PTH1 family peptidyl-tRNA hydrolase
MKSIIDCLSTSEIARIRIGVGHSTAGDHDKVPDWVLSPVPKAEQELWQTALKDAAEAAYAWVSEPLDRVMNTYNIKVK